MVWVLGEILQVVEPPDQKGTFLTAWLRCHLGEGVVAGMCGVGFGRDTAGNGASLIRKEPLYTTHHGPQPPLPDGIAIRVLGEILQAVEPP